MPFVKDYVRYTWQMLGGFRVRHEQGFAQSRDKDISTYVCADQPLRVLDLANGRLRPQYMILKAAGHQVYGIDLVNRPRRTWTDMAYRAARQLYAWKLGVSPDIMAPQALICGDVGKLPFPNNWFDLVTSAAAFEHFLDVPAVVAELQRVIRPGGVVWAAIHLFTCPSGGHNVSFTEFPLRTLPKGVEAWDHLRRRRLPFTVPLNEWRKDQYVAAFASRFEIIKDYCLMREGEELLTPEIAAELSDYNRDELTCATFVIVARKTA
jgi:SAM-dependent methyltransferase